jgi:hypothetical protein
MTATIVNSPAMTISRLGSHYQRRAATKEKDMYKRFVAVSLLAIGAISLSGCNDKVENKTITHYSTDQCFVDLIAGKPDATAYVQRNTVEFLGWAIDTSTQAAPEQLRLRLTGLQGIPHTFGDSVAVDRPDIAKAYNNENLKKAGFYFKADLSSLEPGGYGIILEMPHGKSMLVCQVKKTLVIQ